MMEEKEINIYNKPLYAGLLLSVIDAIVIVITLFFYITDPLELARNAMFVGAAFFIDMVHIFWGYIIIFAIFTLSLVIYNLRCGAERSDYPKIAKAMGVFSIVSVCVAVGLGIWFGLQILSCYGAI